MMFPIVEYDRREIYPSLGLVPVQKDHRIDHGTCKVPQTPMHSCR